MKKNSFLMLMFLWTCIIFSLSLQPADDSSKTSMGVVQWLLTHILPESVVEDEEVLSTLHLIVRKLAHFSEFCLLGVLAANGMSSFRHRYGLAGMYGSIVAIMDESIQLFVDGRAGRALDVLIDNCGACFGVLIVWMVSRGRRR